MKIEAIKNMYRHDLESFFKFSHQILHPHANYKDNWHLQVIADELTKVSRGEIPRLIINIPPRMSKSHCASIALPAWVLGRNPTKKILHLSSGRALGQNLHESCAALMSSSRYRALFKNIRPKIEPNRILTGHGGYRLSMQIDAKITGMGGDLIIIDDPIDALHAQNQADRKRVNEQFDQNIIQRLNDKKAGAIILMMQRVHEEDLTGFLLAKNNDWTHINMPAIALEDETWNLPYGKVHRRKKYEALHPARESFEQLVSILGSIGGYAFAYQYLQGLYKPRFGTEGEGCIWVTPQRVGEFWNARDNLEALHGFVRFKEEKLILPKVFGIGDDLCPQDMRQILTDEEFELWAQVVNQKYTESEINSEI